MYVFLRETPSVGRPSIQINIEEVEFLRALHLPWIRIAEILDISRHTLYRWLKNEGILQELQFTEISDNDLDEVMKGIKEEHPNDGEVFTYLLKAFEFHVHVCVLQFTVLTRSTLHN